MLFVFQVESGRMITFEMSLALESVENLKLHIQSLLKIPVNKQVLMISGGQDLDPEARVCAYPAGTDTNPIFLFSKKLIESDQLPELNLDQNCGPDMAQRVHEAIELPVSFATVNRRTMLAQQFEDVGREQVQTCERVVHEQHLQQQGWAAVVANLEDLCTAVGHRWEVYQAGFSLYISQRDSYLDILKHFKDDLVLLEKLPLLPALFDARKLPDEGEESESVESAEMNGSLLDWISQKDNFMDSLYDICYRGLLQTDDNGFSMLRMDVEAKLQAVDDHKMKEVKGLGDRLFGLDKLIASSKQVAKEQGDLAKAFARNNNSRLAHPKEISVLPDLCATHIQQLNCLLANHQNLRGITRRCLKAKYELTCNLSHRLKWIEFMQDSLFELDNKLVFSYQSLWNLRRQLETLQQVHRAPVTYLSAVAEVVRRRRFSQSFLLWASDVACRMLTIHNEELTRRKDFHAAFEGHFLSSLFPGMEDDPPTFATQAPSVFDYNLPKLSEEDLDKLRQDFPELAQIVNIPDIGAITSFFALRESKDDLDRSKCTPVEDKLMEVVNEAGLGDTMDQNLLKALEPLQTTPHGLPHLKDLDKGCESETDTEEFEKVCQSPFELHFDKGGASPRQDAAMLSEDNLEISRSEHDKLRILLLRVSNWARQTIADLRCELSEVKTQLLREKVLIEESCGCLSLSINHLISEKDTHERETVQRLTVDHELEISDFRKIAQGKNEEIKSLRDHKSSLTAEIDRIAAENAALKLRIDAMDAERKAEALLLHKQLEEALRDKESSIKEVTDRLKSENRRELENIRARFKLMTMERSPSESSLDRTEYNQMRQNFEAEKEMAVSEAVDVERQKWQKELDERLQELDVKTEARVEEAKSIISKDKFDLIESLNRQMRDLRLECFKYKGTIQQLTEHSESGRAEMQQTIEGLEGELERSRAQTSMASSVAVCEGVSKADAATSPMRSKRRSENALRSSRLCTETCKSGDLVLVLWDSSHQNFRILQDNSYMYFLNADCMDELGLKIADGHPNRTFCYAEVVEKEYCHARKPVNRFRVPQGTKFFRVKVKTPREAITNMSQSQSTASSASVVSVDTSSRSAPASPARVEWERDMAQSAVIPEEQGEDAGGSGGRPSESDIERGTELTENFNVEGSPQTDR